MLTECKAIAAGGRLSTELRHLSLVAQLVKNPPAMKEILVRFLVQKVPLEKG